MDQNIITQRYNRLAIFALLLPVIYILVSFLLILIGKFNIGIAFYVFGALSVVGCILSSISGFQIKRVTQKSSVVALIALIINLLIFLFLLYLAVATWGGPLISM